MIPKCKLVVIFLDTTRYERNSDYKLKKMLKCLIILLANLFTTPLFAQFNYCYDNIHIEEKSKCLDQRRNWIRTYKIKSILTYEIRINKIGEQDTLLCHLSAFNTFGNLLTDKTYNTSFKTGKSKLSKEINYSYDNNGNQIEIISKELDQELINNKNSCYYDYPNHYKYTYSNGRLSGFCSFYPDGNLYQNYKYQYFFDSFKKVKILDLVNRIPKTIFDLKYSETGQILSISDYQGDSTFIEYVYDSLKNIIATKHIFPGEGIAIEKTEYINNSNKELVKKNKYNIYGKPFLFSTYSKSNNTIIEKLVHYDLTGDRPEYESETKYNLNGDILYTNKYGREENYEYDHNNILIKSRIIYSTGGKEVVKIFKYEFYD